jgi:uncharacterized protein YbjT (DUF2867 family)
MACDEGGSKRSALHLGLSVAAQRGVSVRAAVHREVECAAGLRATGAEVVVANLTVPRDVARAVEGCRGVYFGMSVSATYLEATVIAAAVVRERGDSEAFVNILQMTVSQIILTNMTESPQQRQHWRAEQVMNWSALPVVHVRPTVFLENPLFMNLAAQSTARDVTNRLPFGTGRTFPVAEFIATILASAAAHTSKVYDLTAPKSQDMAGVAAKYSIALGGRSVMWTWPSTNGAIESFGNSIYLSMSSSIFPRWLASMLPIVMIARPKISRRLPQRGGRVSETLSRNAPVCSHTVGSPEGLQMQVEPSYAKVEAWSYHSDQMRTPIASVMLMQGVYGLYALRYKGIADKNSEGESHV